MELLAILPLVVRQNHSWKQSLGHLYKRLHLGEYSSYEDWTFCKCSGGHTFVCSKPVKPFIEYSTLHIYRVT